LRRTKGINCSFEQVIVFSQTQNALNLLCRLLLSNGDRVAVEEPGFGSIKSIAFSQDLEIEPLTLDEDGAQFHSVKGPLQAMYVTPAHHDPSGTTMSMMRRKQLLELARAKKAWIIEDDFDSDFHYGSKPLPPLAALDAHGNVIYLSSFWKPLYPLTAIGFIVIPPALIPLLQVAKVISEPNSEALEHLVLADFIADGSLERHLQKLRKVYTKQRSALLLSLKQAFKDSIRISKHSAGTHQLVHFDLSADERTILECASASGLGLETTRHYYLSAPPAKEFLLNFTSVSPESAAEVVRCFRKALGKKAD
jgi:GntR family transcriptional regulator/MocR family aminotransferase